jgi:hypothetical protein
MSAVAMISGWFSSVAGTLAMREGPVAGLGLLDTILARGDLGVPPGALGAALPVATARFSSITGDGSARPSTS